MVSEMKLSTVTAAWTDDETRHLGHVLNLMNDRCEPYLFMLPIDHVSWRYRRDEYVFFHIDRRFATEIFLLDSQFKKIVAICAGGLSLRWSGRDIDRYFRSPFKAMSDGNFYIKIRSEDVELASMRHISEKKWSISIRFDFVFVSRLSQSINVGRTVAGFHEIKAPRPPVMCIECMNEAMTA
jgi:hypothetical protein